MPRGSRQRPVEAVQVWLAAAGITEGSVFRYVNKSGRVSSLLGAGAVRAVMKEYAARIGLDPALFSAHSLQSGFLTSGAEGAPRCST